MTNLTASELRTQSALDNQLRAFDAAMPQLLQEWNAPGVGIGVVAGDKLVFARGYGYRDYGRQLPFTPQTLCPIASNTKLFTAVAAGLLVEEGKLTWDEPLREAVPTLRFASPELTNSITLRDMLAHRTGITRHDGIWYQRDTLTRAAIFNRLQYLTPTAPLRQMFLYNNLMYATVGYIIELLSGQTWEEFVRTRIFTPLAMPNAIYSIAEMQQRPEYGVPFCEKRESEELYQIPYYEEIGAAAPAGAVIANLEELAHWLAALMNDGSYNGQPLLPRRVLKETLAPALAEPNFLGETQGWWELLNSVYGMGRTTAVYRGHLLTYHGGNIDGFHSQVSFLPQEKLGVITFVIGDHCAVLADVLTYNLYERFLGLSQTPWSERWLEVRRKDKQAGKEARAKAGAEQSPNTSPSHPLDDYVGEYEHPAYGILQIESNDDGLHFHFGRIQLPLSHFHYDRFDTADDERLGKWSVNFRTNPQGDIDQVVMALDQAEATFTRRAPVLDPRQLVQLAGVYATSSGFKFEVVLKEDGALYLAPVGQPEEKLLPYKGQRFRIERFAEVTFEFVTVDDQVQALVQHTPAGEYRFDRL
ncbi:MAG: serine hydrolase [Caldilineaceae bacterium]